MHHGVDLMLPEYPHHRVPIADLPDHQRGVEHGLAEAARQIIEDHHPLAARAQLQRRMTADVAGAAGD
jgi:hypothetical protein